MNAAAPHQTDARWRGTRLVVNDPIVIRVAFLAPLARGTIIDLTYFGRSGMLGDVVFDEEPAIIDRTTGVIYLSDRFLLPDRSAPTIAALPDALGLRVIKTLSGTVIRAVVVSPVVSNAPLSTQITLVPTSQGSPYRRDSA